MASKSRLGQKIKRKLRGASLQWQGVQVSALGDYGSSWWVVFLEGLKSSDVVPLQRKEVVIKGAYNRLHWFSCLWEII